MDPRASRWDPDGKYLDSLVLATIHSWTLHQPKVNAVNLVLRHFVAQDVYSAMCELSLSIGGDKPGSHRNTADRSAGELYAAELYDMITNLSAKKALPKIVVSSLALPSVPLATLTTSDEVGISARLDTLETGLKKLTEAVTKATNGQAFGGARSRQPNGNPGVNIIPAPQIPQHQVSERVQPVHGQGGLGLGGPVVGQQQPLLLSPSFADVAAGLGGLNRPRLGSYGG